MNRIDVIRRLMHDFHGHTYVEIGVEKGRVFLSIRAKRKLAVDPCYHLFGSIFSSGMERALRFRMLMGKCLELLGREKSHFFQMTSDEFFSQATSVFSESKIDVALVDGLHLYEQALADVENCLRYLAPAGVVVMHDCNPVTPAQAVRARSFEEAVAVNRHETTWNGWWSGDVWKAVVRLRTRRDIEVLVLDCDMGLGIVAQGTPHDVLPFSPDEIAQMSYVDLERNRSRLLNLRPEGHFVEFLRRHSRAHALSVYGGYSSL